MALLRRIGRDEIKLASALAAIYFVWGSTYFAIKLAVASIPPLFAAGARFLIAGLVLYVWARLRGERAPERRQWPQLWLLGLLMFLISYSLLFSAEKTVASGIASVLIATLPVWMAIFEIAILRTQRLTPALSLALAGGLVGVVFVSGAAGVGDHAGGNWLSCLAVVVSAISWAAGSTLSKKMKLPDSHSISAGAQMTCGGVLLLVTSGAIGEWSALRVPPLEAIAAMGYLIVAGSLIAYSSYVWLLGRMSPTRLASYAYVNPVVALAIGWIAGGEALGLRELAGAALVIVSVILILRRKGRASDVAVERSEAPEAA